MNEYQQAPPQTNESISVTETVMLPTECPGDMIDVMGKALAAHRDLTRPHNAAL